MSAEKRIYALENKDYQAGYRDGWNSAVAALKRDLERKESVFSTFAGGRINRE